MSGWRQRETKKAEAEKTKHLELNEINFPSLSASGWDEPSKTSSVKKTPTRSFASLAVEWNAQAEEEKIRKDAEDEKRRIEEYEREQIRKRRGGYNFGTSHAREEDTYYETADDEYIQHATADTADDWQTISKKVRKPPTHFDSVVFHPPQTLPEDETQWDQDYE
jgi:hypothetical protein